MARDCRFVVTVPGGRMSAFDLYIGHRRHYTPASLSALLTNAGFEVELASAAGFPFLNLYRRVVIARGEQVIERREALENDAFGHCWRVRLCRPSAPCCASASRTRRRGTQILARCRPASA